MGQIKITLVLVMWWHVNSTARTSDIWLVGLLWLLWAGAGGRQRWVWHDVVRWRIVHVVASRSGAFKCSFDTRTWRDVRRPASRRPAAWVRRNGGEDFAWFWAFLQYSWCLKRTTCLTGRTRVCLSRDNCTVIVQCLSPLNLCQCRLPLAFFPMSDGIE